MRKLLLTVYRFLPGSFKRPVLFWITKKEGGQMYSGTLRQVFKEKYDIEIGYGTYGGCFNLSNNIPPGVSFGNWCSIAKNIRIFRANHPTDHFTTHPILYNPVAGYVVEDTLDRPKLKIGNDVWIGEWSVILPKVCVIGNGAIIGAGSIVTKDVEPYSIVAGNPARKIGSRFDESVVEILEKERWWEMRQEELKKSIVTLNAKITKNKQVQNDNNRLS